MIENQHEQQAVSSNALAERMITAVKDYVSRAIGPVAMRLAGVEARCGALSMVVSSKGVSAERIAELESLERRIQMLEAKPVMVYRGVWRQGTQYVEGNVVTDRGSAWFCNRSTHSRPGSSGDFVLMVKRGADGQ